MNILRDALPDTVEIDGKKYEINTDFRSCLRIMLAFEDNGLTQQEKSVVLLNNLYWVVPENIKAAFELANWFLNGGNESKENEASPRVYSFSKDANLIFAAFRQTHGIDLKTASLHWWEFLSLFMDLGSETTFCGLVSLRKRIKTGKATKEERQVAMELGDAFDIPEIDDLTLEEREAERKFFELIGVNK